jgi:hypothetical protein
MRPDAIRAALTFGVAGLALALGLWTASIQHDNFAHAALLEVERLEFSVLQAEIHQKTAVANDRNARLFDEGLFGASPDPVDTHVDRALDLGAAD